MPMIYKDERKERLFTIEYFLHAQSRLVINAFNFDISSFDIRRFDINAGIGFN